MKIRTIIATAVTGIVLMAAGSSLAFGADWTCPRGYGDCTSYEYCTTHDHGDCDGHWSEEGDWVCPDGTHSYSCSSSTASLPHPPLPAADAVTTVNTGRAVRDITAAMDAGRVADKHMPYQMEKQCGRKQM